MNKGVNPISVRMATPLSYEVFGVVFGGKSSVAARSIETWVRRTRARTAMHIQG